jgi:anti-sigma B factor antagonist
MQMQTEQIAGTVTKASLNGRLDIAGAQAIDLHFNVLVGQKRAIVVDLSGVSFIASMGLRTLIMGAKTVASKGGRIVLLSPSADVEKVLRDSGTNMIVPIYHDLGEAIAAVGGQP